MKFTAKQVVDVLRQLERVDVRCVLEEVAKDSYNNILMNLKEAISKQELHYEKVIWIHFIEIW